jgi:hypothetical protein
MSNYRVNSFRSLDLPVLSWRTARQRAVRLTWPGSANALRAYLGQYGAERGISGHDYWEVSGEFGEV